MKHTLLVLLVLVALTLVACAPRTTTKPLPPEEGAAYAVEVDAIVENMIFGFSENDFSKITRDMTDKRSEDYDSSVRQLASEISVEWGAYQGKTLDHVEDRGGWRVVIYHLVFENEPDVTLEVSFYISDLHLIGGTCWNCE